MGFFLATKKKDMLFLGALKVCYSFYSACMVTPKSFHLKLICFQCHLFSPREEQKTILPVTSCFSQPLPVSISNASGLPITTSVSVGNLILKTHVMSEDKNDFLKSVANGKMVNS